MHKDSTGRCISLGGRRNDGIERLELPEKGRQVRNAMRIDRKVVMVGDDMKVQRRH